MLGMYIHTRTLGMMSFGEMFWLVTPTTLLFRSAFSSTWDCTLIKVGEWSRDVSPFDGIGRKIYLYVRRHRKASPNILLIFHRSRKYLRSVYFRTRIYSLFTLAAYFLRSTNFIYFTLTRFLKDYYIVASRFLL